MNRRSVLRKPKSLSKFSHRWLLIRLLSPVMVFRKRIDRLPALRQEVGINVMVFEVSGVDVYLWGGFSSQLPTFNPVTASPRGRCPGTRPDSRTADGMVRIDPDGPFPPWHIWLGIPLPLGRVPAHLVVDPQHVRAVNSDAIPLRANLFMGARWLRTTSACTHTGGDCCTMTV